MIREDEEWVTSLGEATGQSDKTPSDKMLAISEPDGSRLRSVAAGARGVGTLGQLGQLLRLLPMRQVETLFAPMMCRSASF